MGFLSRTFAAVVHFLWAIRTLWYLLMLVPAGLVFTEGLPFAALVWGVLSLPVFLASYIYETFYAEQDTHASKRRRGREVIEQKKAKDIASKYRPEEDEGILWGGVRIPTRDTEGYFCIVGAIGSGKSLTIQLLMKDQLPKIAPGSNDRALIYDSKQDQLPLLAGLGLKTNVIVMNPFDTRSYAWNIAEDITTLSQVEEFAAILVPDDKTGNSNPFFTDAIRALLKGVVTVFMLERPGKWTLREVLLVMTDKKLLNRVIRSHSRTQQLAEFFLDRDDSETTGNIYTSIAARLEAFKTIAALWDKTLKENPSKSYSVSQWMQSNDIVVLGNEERSRTLADTINKLFVKYASQHTLSLPEAHGKRKIWYFFDEFREAGEFPGLRELINRGRSKGAVLVVGFQDIDGLQAEYGEKIAEEITGQFAQKAFLRLESRNTAKWASETISTAEYEETTYSFTNASQGASETFAKNIVQRAEVIDAEFLSMPAPDHLNGLHGVYMAKKIGVYKHRYDFEEVLSALPMQNDEVSAFIPRDGADYFIELWNHEDDLIFDSDDPTAIQQSRSPLAEGHAEDKDGLDAVKRIRLDR